MSKYIKRQMPVTAHQYVSDEDLQEFVDNHYEEHQKINFHGEYAVLPEWQETIWKDQYLVIDHSNLMSVIPAWSFEAEYIQKKEEEKNEEKWARGRDQLNGRILEGELKVNAGTAFIQDNLSQIWYPVAPESVEYL